MVVNIASKLPCQHVKAEIIKVVKPRIRLGLRQYRVARRNSAIAKIAQLKFGAERCQARLTVCPDAFKFGTRNTDVEKTVGCTDGIFDIVNEISRNPPAESQDPAE